MKGVTHRVGGRPTSGTTHGELRRDEPRSDAPRPVAARPGAPPRERARPAAHRAAAPSATAPARALARPATAGHRRSGNRREGLRRDEWPALTTQETARLRHLHGERAGRGVEMLQRLLNRIGLAEPVPVTGLFRGTSTPSALRTTLRQLGLGTSTKDPATMRGLIEAAERSHHRPAVRFENIRPDELGSNDARYAYALLRAVGRDDPTLLSRAVQRLLPTSQPAAAGVTRVDAAMLDELGAVLRSHGLAADGPAVRALRALDGPEQRAPSFDEGRAVLSALFDVSYTPAAFFSRQHDAAFQRAAASTGTPPRVPVSLLRALVAQETKFQPTTRPPRHADDPVGPMQITPRAASSVGVTGDITSPETNLLAGAQYLVSLMDKHGARSFTTLVAAWNAGPNRGAGAPTSSNEAPDLTITQHYLRRVLVFRAIYEAR